MSSVTLNWKAVIDRPIPQSMSPTPVATAAGACIVTDTRGTHRYIYALFSATSFWRYDVQTDNWQQLANPVDAITFGAGTDMIFDPSKGTAGYIWLWGPRSVTTWAYWQYYDIATNTWTSRSVTGTALAAAWGTDASLVHTCSNYNAAGNDDFIYLIGNNATVWYRYSIAGNAWTIMANALPAACGAGCAIHWCFGYSTDLLYVIRGTATSTIYTQSIGTPAAWVTLTYIPSTETFTTGSSSDYDGGTRIYIQKDATQRVSIFNLAATYTMSVGPMFPYTGVAIAGDKLATIKSTEATPVMFLYMVMSTGQYMWRILVTW